MAPGLEIGILLAATAAGSLGSMLGLGGGVFIVPILSAFFAVPLKTAVAASAVSVVVNSLTGSAVYLQHRLTNLRLALLMELTTTLGAIGGSVVVVYIAENPLRVIFALALLGMGGAMFLRQRETAVVTPGAPDPLRLRQTYHDPALDADVTYTPRRIPLGIAASTVAGVISGMLGIGGGAVKVPVMNAVMGVPVKAAAGTSMFMVGITVTASAFVYYNHHFIDPSVTAPALLGIVLGAQAGSHLSRRLHSRVLVRVMVVVLVYLAATLLLQAFGIRLPGAR